MRTFAFSLIALLLIVDLRAAEPPLRPALIGNGPKALVNVIDTKKLMEKGQRDGLLMFTCEVSRFGRTGKSAIYRETLGSSLLKEEVGNALWHCRWIPAIYNGEPTGVFLTGTVVFLITDGKPHLRIYMNQSHDDIAKGVDFIAPQVIANSPDWVGSKYDLAAQKARVYHQNGLIQLSVTIDRNGNQRDLKVVSESPPGFGLGSVTMHTFSHARYISGFRNGQPVECTFVFPVSFGPSI
jgi:Gram-negative bacterial TonB protein C-terminal